MIYTHDPFSPFRHSFTSFFLSFFLLLPFHYILTAARIILLAVLFLGFFLLLLSALGRRLIEILGYGSSELGWEQGWFGVHGITV